jgi:hypothetical protein
MRGFEKELLQDEEKFRKELFSGKLIDFSGEMMETVVWIGGISYE